MIYRTLHTYILRELLRVFLLTASALTTLMAFGGMFKPVTKQGIDVSQVMVILVNLMPAMLAYAIPIAALFAAVLVYWRIATDNELTACRAGGISFIAIVMPAFLLGLAVASMDLVFVNYVVPRFLQSTERAVMRDLGSLIVSQVNRQEQFQYGNQNGNLIVTADSAEQLPSTMPDVSRVVLHGVAATYMDKGKPVAMVVGQKATLTIHNLVGQDAAEIDVSVDNASGFTPANAFQKASGSATTLSPDGRPFQVPSYFKSKPKFLNWKDLIALSQRPELFPSVSEVTKKIVLAFELDTITNQIHAWWRVQQGATNGRVTFEQIPMGGIGGRGGEAPGQNKIILQATKAEVEPTGLPQEALRFTGGAGGVRVEQWLKGKLATTYTCDLAEMVLATDQYTGTGVSAALRLSGNVKQENLELPESKPTAVDTQMLSGLILDPALKRVDSDPQKLQNFIQTSQRVSVGGLVEEVTRRKGKLYQQIDSELHSRGSFALSCLTLVLLGAALGILLRGRNPLAVFVVGFVPAIILVMLITAGRQLTEGNPKNVSSGIMLIWAGNVVLLLIVAGVYVKLLRR